MRLTDDLEQSQKREGSLQVLGPDDLLVAGDVEEHHHSTQDAIQDSENPVHRWILLVLSYGATNKASEGKG